MAIRNKTITVHGVTWKIHEAESEDAALDAIAHAAVTGSAGQRDVIHECGGAVRVLADVRRVLTLKSKTN